MSKLIVKCPECDGYVETNPGFWNFLKTDKHKTMKCLKDHVIDIENGRFMATKCSHCGGDIVYDQFKGIDATCPICHKEINTETDKKRLAQIPCPQCGCVLTVVKDDLIYTCPICGKDKIDVQKMIQLEIISKSGYASVIKYEGDNNAFVWKHPIEDFNIGSQLIVHESQEAIFFRNGQALDSFPAGRYTLETESIPLINKLYTSVLDPKDMFHSEVYFVNLAIHMGIKWGTDSKVRFLEPVTNIPFDIGASGEFNIRVSDSRKLVIKLVGTEGGLDRNALLFTETVPDKERSDERHPDYKTGQKSVSGYFRSMIMTRVKTHLAKTIKENHINILEIDEHLDSLSSALRIRINEGLEEYGLTMPEFFVTTVVTPDGEENFKKLKQQHANRYLLVEDEKILRTKREAEAERRMVEARTEAQMEIISAQGKAEAYRLKAEAEAKEMQMKGYTYAQETSRQVGLEAVKGGVIKEGSGTGSDLGGIVGLGVGLGAIGGVINLTKDAIAPIANASSDIGKTVGAVAGTLDGITNPDDGWDCQCGAKAIKGNFCNYCGAKRTETPKPWICSKCNVKNDKGNFCANCGEKKPVEWDCPCGEKSIAGNFCSNCGKKYEEVKNG